MNDEQSKITPKQLGAALYDAMSPDAGGDQPRFELSSIPLGERIGVLAMRWSWQLELTFVIIATLVAFWLRFFDIESIPFGMHGDEANFALDAQRFLNGEHRGIWMPSNLGNPAGYAWWIGAMFTLGESNLMWLRLASVVAGTALVPAVYMLTRQLLGRGIAIMSTPLIIASSWLIIQSRIAFPMILSVFLFVLSAYLIVEAVKRRHLLLAALAGAVFGCGIYSFKAFLILFLATTASVLVLTYFPTQLRKRREPYIFLAVAILVAAPMLNWYLGNDWLINHYWSNYFAGQVGVEISSLFSRFFEVLLLVKNPISQQAIDATGHVALLNTLSQISFFFGLATTLLYIHHRPYQFILLGLFIGTLPAVLAPTAESYRFLLGIVFVLIVAAIGVRSMIYFAWVVITLSAKMLAHNGHESGWINRKWALPLIATAIIVSFFTSYSFSNKQHFDDWRNSEWGLNWYFEADFIDALNFVDGLDGDFQIVLYSGRRSVNDTRRAFLYPDMVGFDGAREHGGDGLISANLVDRNTAFILMGHYIELADDIEALYPDARRVERVSEFENTEEIGFMYVAYLVRGS